MSMAVTMAGNMLAIRATTLPSLNVEGSKQSSLRNFSSSTSYSPSKFCRAPRLTVKSAQSKGDDERGRRAAVLGLGTALFTAIAASGNAKANLVDDLLEKSKANKALNDKKRLATSGANIARAYTVEFGTCQFPYNFTGCQDLAKIKDVPFLTDDIKLECEGKDKYKCGSNVFWTGK